MSSENTFQKKKSLGQHFLTSDVVPKWMCDAAAVIEGDTVVEIGPGTGALTRELLARGARVVALEADIRALAVLAETYEEEIASKQLLLHHTDARTLDLSQYGLKDHNFKIVANIPYYISGMLFRSCLESVPQPSTLLFLVQKEVAERIARSKKESLLSLSVAVFGEPEYVRTVSRGHFSPPPKVESAIIAVRNIHRENLRDIQPEAFFTLLHLGFGQKRKQLLGNLAKTYDRAVLTHIFSTLDIPHDVRAEDVPLQKWLTLAREVLSTPRP